MVGMDAPWTAVDEFLTNLLIPDNPTLDTADLPAISVSAPQGRLLHLLVRLTGARRVLEVGTLAGYSAWWLATALPDGGRLVTLEVDPHHAAVARANLAGLPVDVVVGPAAASLASLEGPFDLVFVDADKPGNVTYLREALRLSRPGTLIVLDNVVRQGAVLSPEDENARGTRDALEWVAAEPRLTATAIQMVGAKGWDGMLFARITSAVTGE
jgi:predicted O-methyltransferase YrrM